MATITTQERTNILKLVAGMFNAAPGANYLNEFTTAYQALGNNFAGLATALGNTGAFKSLYPSTLTATEFATKFLTTLGLQANADAAAWVQAKVNSGASFSSVILQAVSALDATSDSQYTAAKALLANKAAVAEYYSVPSPVGVAVSSENLATLQNVFSKVTSDTASVQIAKDAILSGGNGQSNTLTTGQDVVNGTAGNDIIRGVAGQPVNAQDQSTFNSSDIIDGGAGDDKLVINMTGPKYAGGATVKNVETLQIGSNLAAASFDYNVNQGAYEINGVNTVIYDQITVGETLVVDNLTPTAAAKNPIPVLSWENEAGSLAGVAGVTYRQATISTTNDNQVVNLKNVNNGTLNIGAGIETLTINSQGTAARNTLINTTNTDTGTFGVAADLISNGSLNKVVINATTELGKVGGRVATTGLVDRVATDGTGDGLTGTAANLLSVGARVNNVTAADADAGVSTAAVNVQFVAKTDGSATNVTFVGGKGNDYVEFEVGNVNAAGGEGNDTFAFITQRAGVTNSTFGAGDSIVGGAGTDTIQIGSNGVGTYTISDSEWANKSGIEVVDLRGTSNTVTLSSTFVGATDAGVKLTVTTDNIVVGGTAPVNDEYNAVSTVDLRTLSAGQGIKFVGGQGSDRIVLSDTTFTSNMELAGGSNVDNAGNAVTAHYDTLNVSNSAVLDRTDLANVSGFEGLVLSKTVTGAVTDVIELTEAFLLANTAATNSTTTSIDDRVFQIGTTASANGTALGATDTVRIDVTDLFTVNNNTVKSTLAGRQIDVTSLTNAGVTVQYVYNGKTYANLAALTTEFASVGGNNVLNGKDANFAHVTVDSAAGASPAAVVPVANVALTAGGTFTGTTGTNDNFTAATLAALNGTTVNATAADTETLTLGAAMTVALNNGTTGGTLTNIDNLVLANGANVITFGATGSGITSITGGTGNDDVSIDNLAASASVNLGAGNDTLRASGVLTGTLAGGDGVSDTLTGTATAATNISGATVSGFEVLDFGNSATTFTMTRAQFAGFSSFTNFTAGAANADGITFSDAGAVALSQAVGTYNLANGTNTVDATANANFNITGGTGADTINFGAQLTANDTVAAGTGTDIITVTGAAAGSANITGVETIQVNYATAATFTTGAIAPGVASTITAAGSTGAVTLDASSYNATTSLTIVDGQGNDTITVSSTDAQRAITTVNLSSGGNDIVAFGNATAAGASANAVTINNFTAGNGQDQIKFNVGATAINAGFQNITAAATNLTAPASSVIAIASTLAQSTSSDAADAGALESLIANAIGNAANGEYLVVVYGGGNARLVHVTTTANGADLTAANSSVELVGVINNVAVDSLVAGNFA